MPVFSTPFNGNNNDKKLSVPELIRAIRFGIASEFEAIQFYEQLEDSIDNKKAKVLLHEIADDEKVHVGNFLYLLKLLSEDEEKHYRDGMEEGRNVINGKEED